MRCVITSIKDTTTYDKLKAVALPAKRGMVEIRPGHAEYITTIDSGEVVIKPNSGAIERVTVSNGVVHVYKDTVTVVV